LLYLFREGDQAVQLIGQHKIVLLLLCFILGLILSACNPSALSNSEAKAVWQTSAHSNWYIEEIPENSTACAKCHNALGYLKFLGVEGSSANQFEEPASTDITIKCQVCHNEVAETRDFIVMPSGLEISGLGQESNCLECHQGLASSLQVAETIADNPKDLVDPNLTMPNLHANAAGATFYGTQAQGGAEYPQYQFSSKFYHIFDTCGTCHDPHTLQVRVDKCSACHLGATSLAGVRNIRLSRIDYDGDGDITEGLEGEINTMMEKLWITMQLYAALTDGADLIAYYGGFLNEVGEKYTTWTPNLLQAAYNYHYAAKDSGGYSHNPKYIMQLLYDSIDELGGRTRGMTRPTTAE
jgi:Zn finger protein HypA/HybF involved in hydrogenase expression